MPHSEILQALQQEDPTKRVKALKRVSEANLDTLQPLVIENLSHANAEVQAAAAFALRYAREPVAEAELLKALEHPQMAVKVAAIFTLGEWNYAPAVPALLPHLTSPTPVLRSRVAEALRKIGDAAAVEGLYAALETEENLKVALRLAEALLALQDARVIPVLTAALAYDEAEIRNRAVEIMVSYPHVEMVSALLDLLKEDDQVARAAAVYVLGKVGGLDVPALLAALVSPVRAMRSGVSKAVGELGPALAQPEVLAALMQGLQDEDHRVRTRAAQALGKLEAVDAIPALEQCLLKDSARRVRWRAAEALRVLDARTAQSAFIAAMTDAYSSVRLECIRALASWKVSESIPHIAEALQDEIRRVRRAAAKALGDLGDYRALAPLRDVLWQDPEESVRLAATRALGQLRQNLKDTAEALLQLEEQTVLGLTDVLQDSSDRVRSEAISELVIAGSDTGVDALLELLEDESPVLRAEAATALGALGSVRATAAVLNSLNDSDSQVRNAAVQALVKLIPQWPEQIPGWVDMLMAGLEGAGSRFRNSAGLVLSQLAPQLVEWLLPYLEHDNARVRASVLFVLGESGDGRAFGPVSGSLQDPVSRVRTAAAEALEKLIQGAIEPLIETLTQDDSPVKSRSIQAMGRILHQVKPVLEAASSATVEDDEMRSLAHGALEGVNENVELVL